MALSSDRNVIVRDPNPADDDETQRRVSVPTVSVKATAGVYGPPVSKVPGPGAPTVNVNCRVYPSYAVKPRRLSTMVAAADTLPTNCSPLMFAATDP